MHPPSWTPERIATLVRLWTDGLSAGEIAARFPGVTRNAVLGKLHRLGRLGRGRPTTSVRPAKAKRPPAPSERRSQAAGGSRRPSPEPAPPSWAGEVAQAEALQAWHCRWPIGDPRQPGFAFCGRRVAARPYCEAHRAIAYRSRATRHGEPGAYGERCGADGG